MSVTISADHPDTIAALSSGHGRAGVAVVRISGPAVRFLAETMLDRVLQPRRMALTTIKNPETGVVLDRALAVSFPAPASATGEDLLELHVHGGPAIVAGVLRAVTAAGPRIRLAEPGEFTRRAFENGKLDLVQVEALGDALEAETAQQLAQAQRLLAGELSTRIESWSMALLSMRAAIEAELDFSDEGDVEVDASDDVRRAAGDLMVEICSVIAGSERGRIARDGVRVVLFGAPNVGKSSLLNALAQQEIAIVTSVPGTTRDVVTTRLDIGGWAVILSDTAGLRESSDIVESEGIRRAKREIERADITMEMRSVDTEGEREWSQRGERGVIRVASKADLGVVAGADIVLSTATGVGVGELLARLRSELSALEQGEPPLVARERQRVELEGCVEGLRVATSSGRPEVVAEGLRQAHCALGRLTGHIDVERVLDKLFSSFCIGK
jgi:tRNA modification GTPase